MFTFFCASVFLMTFSPAFVMRAAAPLSRTPLIAEQIEKLDTLIQATEQSLAGERKVRKLVVEYKELETLFLQHPEDNDILHKMVRHAFRALEAIKENHLTHTFDAQFIEELTVLAQAAAKRGLPKPQ